MAARRLRWEEFLIRGGSELKRHLPIPSGSLQCSNIWMSSVGLVAHVTRPIPHPTSMEVTSGTKGLRGGNTRLPKPRWGGFFGASCSKMKFMFSDLWIQMRETGASWLIWNMILSPASASASQSWQSNPNPDINYHLMGWQNTFIKQKVLGLCFWFITQVPFRSHARKD